MQIFVQNYLITRILRNGYSVSTFSEPNLIDSISLSRFSRLHENLDIKPKPWNSTKIWKIIFVKIKTTRKQTDDFAAWKKGKQRVKFSRPMSSLKKFIAKNAIQMWVAKNEKKEREENLESGKHEKFTIQINSST